MGAAGVAGPVGEVGGASETRRAGTAGPEGEATDPGNGLRGLRERARLAGAVILTRSMAPHGFELTLQVQR